MVRGPVDALLLIDRGRLGKVMATAMRLVGRANLEKVQDLCWYVCQSNINKPEQQTRSPRYSDVATFSLFRGAVVVDFTAVCTSCTPLCKSNEKHIRSIKRCRPHRERPLRPPYLQLRFDLHLLLSRPDGSRRRPYTKLSNLFLMEWPRLFGIISSRKSFMTTQQRL